LYCIIVKVQLKDGASASFLKAIRENAAASVRDEPGCLVFDVLADREHSDVFHLYEVYSDEAALAAHKTTAHYQASRKIINDLIQNQTVTRCDVLAMNPGR